MIAFLRTLLFVCGGIARGDIVRPRRRTPTIAVATYKYDVEVHVQQDAGRGNTNIHASLHKSGHDGRSHPIQRMGNERKKWLSQNSYRDQKSEKV